MSYNKAKHLRANIEAIKFVILFDKFRTENPQADFKRMILDNQEPFTAERLTALRNYSGFGAIKCVLLPCETEADKRHWTATDLPLFDMVKELHTTLDTLGKEVKSQYLNSISLSVLTAFYTPEPIVTGIAMGILNEDMGGIAEAKDKPLNILDPSAGSGVFIDAFSNPVSAFSNAHFRAYESDILTAKILEYTHPNHEIYRMGFERFSKSETHPRNGYDIITSNIPFGDFSIYDKEMFSGDKARALSTKAIHNYFFIKGLDTLREGGLLAYITSTGVASSTSNEQIREYLMKNANLISCIRLPNNTFTSYAGTEVASDIIILQKNSNKEGLSDAEKAFIFTKIKLEIQPISTRV